MPYGSTGCTYHQLKYSFSNHSNNNKKTRATQKSLPLGKWRFRGKNDQGNGPKAEKEKTERATGLGRRTREELSKSGIKDKLTALRFQTEGRHYKSPGLPSG